MIEVVAVSRGGTGPGKQMTWTFVQVIKGGAEGTRTPDPHTASVVRYQLRHSPLLSPVARALTE
jgi:hypothetical protein